MSRVVLDFGRKIGFLHCAEMKCERKERVMSLKEAMKRRRQRVHENKRVGCQIRWEIRAGLEPSFWNFMTGGSLVFEIWSPPGDTLVTAYYACTLTIHKICKTQNGSNVVIV